MKPLSATTVMVVICCLLGLVFVVSGVSKLSGAYNSNKYEYSDHSYSDPGYIRDTYESCCSTSKHKQAIYSYDVNNDNSISAQEMELFLSAHPNAVNDKPFMAWLEAKTN